VIKWSGIWILLFFVSCIGTEESVEVVARAYDEELTWDEIRAVIPDNTMPEDSVLLAERFISEWLKEQVVLNYAENLLSDDQKNFDDQLDNYRRSLLTYAFENELIKQKMDTVVNQQEIANYYEEHIQNFSLKDYIVRARFSILDTLTPVTDDFRALMFSDNEEDLVSLESLCVELGASYFIHEDQWLYFDELREQVPVDVYDVESFLKKTKKVEFKKNDRLFFLKIADYKLKDGVSPLSLEENNIRNIILNQRKRTLLSKMRDDLYRDALEDKKVNTYYE
jgi:hypothetical protein